MIPEKPLVSVIIPNYNYGRFLGQTLNSLLAQDYENWEAIIVDNHSTDDSDEVYQSFSSDARIRILKVHNGGSIAHSRNKGIQESTGSIIAFLDSDDLWAPCKLSRAVEAHQSGVDIVYHDLLRLLDGDIPIVKGRLRSWRLKKPLLRHLLRDGNALLNSSVSLDVSVISRNGLFSESLEIAGAEDYEYWLRCAQACMTFAHLPMALGQYRIHIGSVSRKDMSGKLSSAVAPYRGDLDYFSQRRLDATISYTAGRHHYLSREINLARTQLGRVLVFGMFKFQIRSLFMLLAMNFWVKGGR